KRRLKNQRSAGVVQAPVGILCFHGNGSTVMTESSPTPSQAPAGQPVTPPPQSSVRNLWRWLLWSVLILVLCAVLLLLAGGWYLQRWLQVQGIEELDIQVQSWA